MSMQSLVEYSSQPNQHEPVKPIHATWHHMNGSVPVTIIAYSLGATLAYCIIGLGDVLESANFSTAWLPVAQLQYP